MVRHRSGKHNPRVGCPAIKNRLRDHSRDAPLGAHEASRAAFVDFHHRLDVLCDDSPLSSIEYQRKWSFSTSAGFTPAHPSYLRTP